MTERANRKAVGQLLVDLDSAVIVSHIHPDSDAYGSSFALAESLSLTGKKIAVVNESGLFEHHEFLSGGREVLRHFPEGEWPVVVVLDCGDINRVGDILAGELGRFQTVINIDHHYANTLFGTHNLVEERASSTCEIIYELLSLFSLPVTESIATALLTGMVGDTGSFRYSCTTDRTLLIASRLVEAGASPEAVANRLYGSTPLSVIKVESEAFSNLHLYADGKVAEVVVTEEMFRESGARPFEVDGLAEKARDILGVCISAYIRFDHDVWKVSLRSVDARYNVADAAQAFGGGGHRQAAAFRWRGNLDELRKALAQKLESITKEANGIQPAGDSADK